MISGVLALSGGPDTTVVLRFRKITRDHSLPAEYRDLVAGQPQGLLPSSLAARRAGASGQPVIDLPIRCIRKGWR